MKIIFIRPFGRNAVNVMKHCLYALNSLDIQTKVVNFNPYRLSKYSKFLKNIEFMLERKKLINSIKHFCPDFIFVIKGDNLNKDILNTIRQETKIPIANWWIDDPGQINTSKLISPYYDFFFTSAPLCITIHREAGCKNVYLVSYACNPETHKKYNLSLNELKYYTADVSFVGMMNTYRHEVLESISDFNLKVWWSFKSIYCSNEGKLLFNVIKHSSSLYQKIADKEVWDDKMVKAYNSSKIVLNIHSPGDYINMRVFEVTGCGTLLLTDHENEVSRFFIPGKEVVTYKDKNDLRNKIQYFLYHPGEREEIARCGQQRAYSEHTYLHRIKEILSFIKSNGI